MAVIILTLLLAFALGGLIGVVVALRWCDKEMDELCDSYEDIIDGLIGSKEDEV